MILTPIFRIPGRPTEPGHIDEVQFRPTSRFSRAAVPKYQGRLHIVV